MHTGSFSSQAPLRTARDSESGPLPPLHQRGNVGSKRSQRWDGISTPRCPQRPSPRSSAPAGSFRAAQLGSRPPPSGSSPQAWGRDQLRGGGVGAEGAGYWAFPARPCLSRPRPGPGLEKPGARASTAPRSRRACHFLSVGRAGLEDEGARTSTTGLLRHLGLLSAETRQQLGSASSQRRGQRQQNSRRRPEEDGPALARTPSGRVRGARARRGRGWLGLRLRKAVPDAAPAQWWGGAGRREAVVAAAAAEEEEEGSGGRCFCQFRLFVREVDPPLPEQPGGSCGSRGQYRPRLPARTAPARHGPGLRPPLQAAHHRRQR